MRRINRNILWVLIAILGVYLALLDIIAKPLFEYQASEIYGAEVSIDSLDFSPFRGQVTLHQLSVADRRNAMRNLAQAERVYVDIDMEKLAGDVIDVEELNVEGLALLTRRTDPATILRPLLPPNSDIATAGLPNFDFPDVDGLIAKQREKLDTDLTAFTSALDQAEIKWVDRLAELPDRGQVFAYKQRVMKLRHNRNAISRLAGLAEMQNIYVAVSDDARKLQAVQQEFREDVQLMRAQVDAVTSLAANHANQLIDSLGLSPRQMAQIGSQVLRGDLSGISQQVLAPLAYNASGQVNAENSMAIFIRHGTIAGSILPSAAGFSAQGEIENFAWPLELADLPALLKLEGSSLDGGSMLIEASIDHRSQPADLMRVEIDDLSLRNMLLEGTEALNIELNQALANISGEMRVDGEALSGRFTQNFSEVIFHTELRENAGDSARLLAAVLDSNTDFNMNINFAGTLQSPRMSFSSDLDSLIWATLRNAISERVTALTQELENRISREMGPQIASVRDRMAALTEMQEQLDTNLHELGRIK
jgi:hypothetical protein